MILYDSERNSYHCETLDEDNLYVVIGLFTALENKYCSLLFLYVLKGQLISKANCQTVISSKKRTNEFVFTTMGRVFVRFLGESSARKFFFEIF